jgi:hypothetical protein
MLRLLQLCTGCAASHRSARCAAASALQRLPCSCCAALSVATTRQRLFCVLTHTPVRVQDVLARAFSRSLEALFVPLFLLLLVVTSSSFVLFELERSQLIDFCKEAWHTTAGVSYSFMRAQPAGVQWSCDEACNGVGQTSSDPDGEYFCATCTGFPTGCARRVVRTPAC